MYLVIDLCGIAINRRGEDGRDGRDGKDGLRKIVLMVEKFLEESNYEEISDTFAKLKL